MPEISLRGAASNTWVYVAVIFVIGLILAIGVGIMLFMMTYKKRVVFFENIAGRGYQPVLKTKARVLKVGSGGEELLKTLSGGYMLSAYGKKMGKNTYWYAKGQDGYFYNVLLGDLDAKQGMLDIEPIDRDVRMFHVALDRITQSTYGKQNFFEKYGVHLMLFVFLIVLIGGIWFIVGQIGEAVEPLAQSGQTALEVQQMNVEITQRLEAVARLLGHEADSIQTNLTGGGLAPA